jgi:dUTP pyrophosphatase
MKVRIKRFDKDLPLPQKHTEGAAAFDLTARESVTIEPGNLAFVPLNIAVETPPGYFLLVAARSSTPKRGLMKANGIGIVDPDFAGDADEVRALFYNFTAAPVTIERGDRVAQGIFIKFTDYDWDEVDEMKNETRGGFGSTGK